MNGFDSSGYETKQVFYSSKDGTKVPMFVVHRKVSAPAVKSFKACSAATHGAVTVDTQPACVTQPVCTSCQNPLQERVTVAKQHSTCMCHTTSVYQLPEATP